MVLALRGEPPGHLNCSWLKGHKQTGGAEGWEPATRAPISRAHPERGTTIYSVCRVLPGQPPHLQHTACTSQPSMCPGDAPLQTRGRPPCPPSANSSSAWPVGAQRTFPAGQPPGAFEQPHSISLYRCSRTYSPGPERTAPEYELCNERTDSQHFLALPVCLALHRGSNRSHLMPPSRGRRYWK